MTAAVVVGVLVLALVVTVVLALVVTGFALVVVALVSVAVVGGLHDCRRGRRPRDCGDRDCGARAAGGGEASEDGQGLELSGRERCDGTEHEGGLRVRGSGACRWNIGPAI